MARYSRRQGPTVDHLMQNPATLVAGFTITRHYDDGEVLILYSAEIKNIPGPANIAETFPRLDGAPIRECQAFDNIPAGDILHQSGSIIIPITRGVHTIDLFTLGIPQAGHVLTANRANLTVIQLPQWDQANDIL